MSRPNLTPLVDRVGVQTQTAQPSLDVSASPVSTVGNNTRAKDFALGQFIENMRGFTGAAAQFAQAQDAQTIEREQERALMDSIQSNGAKPILEPTQSAYYQKASMQLFGKASAAKALTELQEKISSLQDDPEALRGLDPQAFLQQWAQSNLAGIDDPDVASEVYPTIQQTIPRYVASLADMKRAQLGRDIKAQKEETLNSAYNLAAGTLGAAGENFTPENMWSVFETLVPLVGEQEAAKALYVSAKTAVDGGGLLGASEVLRSRNPRNGWALEQYLGDDVESRTGIASLHKFVEEKRLAVQKEEEAETFRLQTEQRADSLRALNALVESGGTPTPSQIAGLTPGELAEVQVKIAKREAPRIRRASIVQAATQVGFNNVTGASAAEKQEVWDEYTAKTLSGPVNPSDPQSALAHTAQLRTVLLRHADNSTQMSLNSVFSRYNGVENLPAPSEMGNVVPPQALLALRAYQEIASDASLRSYLKEFTPATREYLRTVDTLLGPLDASGQGRSDPASAFSMAKTMNEPTNIEARNQFVKNQIGAVQEAVFSVLDTNEWFGTTVGPQVKEHVAASLPAWLDTNALTVRDPQVLGRMFAQDFNKQFLSLEDPDIDRSIFNPRGWGGNDERRVLLLPEDRGGLTDQELSEAVVLGEQNLGAELGKKYGEGTFRFRMVPGNKKTLQVYRNGQPLVGLAPLPWSDVIKHYKDNVAVRSGVSRFTAAPPVTSKAQAEAEAKARVNRLYSQVQQGAAKTEKKSTKPLVEVPSSNALPVGKLNVPNVGPKPVKGTTSKNDRYAPPTPMAGAMVPPPPKPGALPPLTDALKARLGLEGIGFEEPPKS